VRVSFNDLAERELNDAAAYYELEQADLGGAFIAAVEQCVDAIVAHPMAGAATTRDIRRRLCLRFPYALLYRPTDAEIRILAVMNLRRRPGYWVGRA
jgi:plasmid stabilization system protein ParE